MPAAAPPPQPPPQPGSPTPWRSRRRRRIVRFPVPLRGVVLGPEADLVAGVVDAIRDQAAEDLVQLLPAHIVPDVAAAFGLGAHAVVERHRLALAAGLFGGPNRVVTCVVAVLLHVRAFVRLLAGGHTRGLYVGTAAAEKQSRCRTAERSPQE